jgi:mono/diheme cytochrome c family protein
MNVPPLFLTKPRSNQHCVWCCIAIVCGVLGPSLQPVDAQDPTDSTLVYQERYEQEIKSILRARCYSCHGVLQQQAGLRLDTVASMLNGGDEGPAIISGNADESILVARISTTDSTQRMPPTDEGEPLSEQQIDMIREWVQAGAPGPQDEQPEQDPASHWAFRPIVRPAIPMVEPAAWQVNPIDAFVADQHQKNGLTPQRESSRVALLRRVTVDLIGVPPTLEELDAISADNSEDWYERAVTRLLDDPRYGERWGRHWMDVWRYSDWWGLGDQLRNSQKHIWHWRDWIVESLNEDMPYDEMVRLMLAADELRPNDLQSLRASGYLARNYFLFNRNQWMDETVEHVSKGFLGLTANCAKCHDHKYDPISQRDYYRLRAFFEPYHVRLDVVPGVADLAQDGIPRAFDGLPDLPTYLFIRGQEKDPDTTASIEPGVPQILAFEPLGIEPVHLPIEAWQPERREWVADANIVASENRVALAAQKVKAVDEKLASVTAKLASVTAKLDAHEKDEASPNSALGGLVDAGATNFVDAFDAFDPNRWQTWGGDWQHVEGRMQQRRDGATQSALRLKSPAPRDFDATLTVTIVGGSQWRSVGLSFDASQLDPTTKAGPEDSEQNVYISAVAGGTKLQGAVHQGGNWQYPGEAMVARPIELGQEYRLRIQVRDTLVNAWLNDQLVLAWRTPLPRKEGYFQITCFDAIADISELRVAELTSDTVLRLPPSEMTNGETLAGASFLVDEAKWESKLANLEWSVAQAELSSMQKRAVALRSADVEDARAASRAERELVGARAQAKVADAELQLHRAKVDQVDAKRLELVASHEAVEAASKQLDVSSDQFTSFVGAQWTPTRFFNSLQDDPAVPFPAQSTGRRLALARWITSPANPLTARVTVNQIWSRHFARPLVDTVFDFGRKGTPPTHPELLDWLSAELVSSGWSMKHIHRLIVQSATYRLSTSVDHCESNLSIDAENRYLWRRTPSRLESHAVRDSILALTGTLDFTRGGPSIPTAAQADSKRRSLYFFHSNNDRNLFLTMFDEALVKECYRREQSVVPQQALALTNSRLVLEAAPSIAECFELHMKTVGIPVEDDEKFVVLAFAAILGVEVSDDEMAACRKALGHWNSSSASSSSTSARSNLIWVLLNHNDFLSL